MIQDVVELRENNWVPRRVEAKPQRIEDIHREHAKEEQQKKMEAAVAASSRKSKSSKYPNPHPGYLHVEFIHSGP